MLFSHKSAPFEPRLETAPELDALYYSVRASMSVVGSVVLVDDVLRHNNSSYWAFRLEIDNVQMRCDESQTTRELRFEGIRGSCTVWSPSLV